nr:hypothetical protein BaRGS_011307 [Batillaria attramentaria]
MYALNLARYSRFPDVKQTGTAGLPNMCVLTSEKAHYSIKKGAALLGLGTDNVVTVKTDSVGRMCPKALDVALCDVTAQGRVPIMVNATAGTTVLGAYDPLDAIADVCTRHKVWLHVDGAWGGSVLLSDKLRHRMKGVERADSMTWNPHKMMGAPLQCAAFLTKHKTLLTECHSARAKYLFQQDKFYDVTYDTGDKSVQCGRKVDVLKLWMMWKAKGTQQFAADIENIFNCAQYLAQKVKTTEGFRIVLEEVAPAIKQRMTKEGSMMVGYQPDGHLVNFFRMVISNTAVTTRNMDFVVSEIARLGEDL